MRWRPTSHILLEHAENSVLRVLRSEYVTRDEVVDGPDGPLRLHWLEAGSGPPLVLMHGFGAGCALWVHQIDALAEKAKVYALDLPGFSRSERVDRAFRDAEEAEAWLLSYVHAWVKSIPDLDDGFYVLGHSFGSYIAAAYALEHPRAVRGLLLADAWGVARRPTGDDVDVDNGSPALPLLMRLLKFAIGNVSPMAPMRAVGPLGPWLLATVRRDIPLKFAPLFPRESLPPGLAPDEDEDEPLLSHVEGLAHPTLRDRPWASKTRAQAVAAALPAEVEPAQLRPPKSVVDYIYHSNAQLPATGEAAFIALQMPFAWSRRPLVDRLPAIDPAISVRFVYGEQSWVDRNVGVHLRDNHIPHAEVYVIERAGHHLYADQPLSFSDLCTSFITNETPSDPNIRRL